MLKARDVRRIIKEHGIERGTVQCLEVLAEDNSVMRQQMSELGQMLDQMADILTNFTTVAEHMKSATDVLRKKEAQDDDDTTPTH